MVRVKTKQVFISYHSWLDSWSDGGVWGRGLLRIPQWQRQSQECRNLGTLGKLWIFCTTNVHFPDENAIHIWIKYILPAFLFQNILKAFCLLFQNAYKPSFCPSVSGLGQYARVPTALGCGSDWHGAELRDLSQSSRMGSQQGSVWQWQHSIQLCNPPTLLMHFTLSWLNCFGLLISFSSSKRKFFPSFPCQRVLPYAPNQLQPFWCFVTAHILACIKKTPKQNQTSLSISVSALTKLKFKYSLH